jgi:large conductance mechanosensitive channel
MAQRRRQTKDNSMGMIGEFKEFIARGNVVDLAVGVVIGAAFGKIVTTLVDKIIMPPIGYLIGGIDFSKWAWTLKEATVDAAGKEVPAIVVGIGEFLNTVIQFVIVAFAIFLLVKAVNRLHRRPEAAPAAPPEDVLLLREIRDALKK